MAIEPATKTSLKDVLISVGILIAFVLYMLVAAYFNMAGLAFYGLLITVIIGLVLWQTFINPREWREVIGKFLLYALLFIVALTITVAFGVGVYMLAMKIV